MLCEKLFRVRSGSVVFIKHVREVETLITTSAESLHPASLFLLLLSAAAPSPPAGPLSPDLLLNTSVNVLAAPENKQIKQTKMKLKKKENKMRYVNHSEEQSSVHTGRTLKL